MNDIFFRASACAALLALAACGGGGAGGNEPISLESKTDALRELGVATAALTELPDPLPAAPAVAEAKRLGELPDFGRADGQCGEEGTSVLSPGTKTRNFTLLQAPLSAVNVSFSREVSTNCMSVAEAPVPRTGTLRYNGVFEQGSSATLGDGSRVGYITDGQGSNGYLAIYLQRLGTALIDTQIGTAFGTIEKRVASDGATDLSAVYGYSYDREDNTGNSPVRSFSVVQLGKSGLPFRKLEAGPDISLNGPYTYSTTGCAGGEVMVTTEETLKRDDGGEYVDGKLRLAIGQRFAVFDFNAEGGATLNLNGTTQVLTPTEVQAVLDQSPC